MLRDGRPVFLAPDVESSRTLARMLETPALRVFSDNRPNAKKPKTGADLAIAAVAIAHDCTVVTADADLFIQIHRHFPLPGLYDPFRDEWHVPPRTAAGPAPRQDGIP